MRHYGLIGKHLSHSFSKNFFTAKFANEGIDADYALIEIDDISTIDNHPNHSGIRSSYTQWLCHFDSITYITGSTNYCSRNVAAMGAELWVPHHHRLFLIPSNPKTLLSPRAFAKCFSLKKQLHPTISPQENY